MLRGCCLLAAISSPHLTARATGATSAEAAVYGHELGVVGVMSATDAVDNLLAADGVRERMRMPGVQPIRIEADFVTCTQ
eukprot:COSAG02_NODE_4080_length_5818_cov_17.059101_1_plen_80_part_00